MASLDLLSTFVTKEGEKLLDGIKDDLLDVIEEAAGMDQLLKPDGSIDLVRAVQLLVDVAASDEASINADALKVAFVDIARKRLGQSKKNAIVQVKTWVAAMKNDLLAKLPEGVQPLAQRLDELEGGHTWPLNVQTGTSIQLKEGIGMDLAASAGAQLSLKALSASTADLSPATIDSAFDYLLHIGLLGALDARLSGDQFFGGMATVSAGGKSGIHLDYYYAHRSDRLLIAALLNDLRSLASPFALSDVAVAGKRQLSQIRMGVSGELQVSAAFTASHAYMGSIGDIGGKSLPLEAGVSLGFSGELSRSGNYELKVTPTNDGWVRVGVHYADIRQGKAGLEFNAGMTISDIDKVFGPLLKERLPEAEPILAVLEELSNPGAWVRQELKEALKLDDDEGLKQRLLTAFLDDKEKVSQVMGDAIEDAVNLSDIDWAGDAASEAKKVLARLTQRLPVTASLAADVRDHLEEKVNSVITKYVGEVENKVKTAGKQKLADLRGLLGFFDVPEDKFDAILDKLDERAKELVAPIKDVVSRYQSLRSKIISAVEKTSSISMKLAIGKLWSKIDAERGALEFGLKAGDPKAETVYRAILHGDVSKAIKAARNDEEFIRVESATLTEFLSESSTSYLKFSIMDGALTSQHFARSEISITRDISGNIIAFAGKLKSHAVLAAFGRRKEAAFLNDLSLAARANLPGQRLINTASVTLSFADEDLKPSEVDEYLASGQQAGLVSQRVVENIRAMYDTVRAADNDDETSATIDLAMNLPPGEMFEVIGQSPELIRRTALKALWDQLPPHEDWNLIKNMAREIGSSSGPANLIDKSEWTWGHTTLQKDIEKKLRKIPNLRQANERELKPHLRRLSMMVHHANAFTKAMLKLGQLAALSPSDENLKEEASRLQKGIARDLKPWLKPDISTFWKDQIPRRNLALIQALADLSGESEPLIGVVSKLDSNGVQTDVILDDF